MLIVVVDVGERGVVAAVVVHGGGVLEQRRSRGAQDAEAERVLDDDLPLAVAVEVRDLRHRSAVGEVELERPRPRARGEAEPVHVARAGVVLAVAAHLRRAGKDRDVRVVAVPVAHTVGVDVLGRRPAHRHVALVLAQGVGGREAVTVVVLVDLLRHDVVVDRTVAVVVDVVALLGRERIRVLVEVVAVPRLGHVARWGRARQRRGGPSPPVTVVVLVERRLLHPFVNHSVAVLVDVVALLHAGRVDQDVVVVAVSRLVHVARRGLAPLDHRRRAVAVAVVVQVVVLLRKPVVDRTVAVVIDLVADLRHVGRDLDVVVVAVAGLVRIPRRLRTSLQARRRAVPVTVVVLEVRRRREPLVLHPVAVVVQTVAALRHFPRPVIRYARDHPLDAVLEPRRTDAVEPRRARPPSPGILLVDLPVAVVVHPVAQLRPVRHAPGLRCVRLPVRPRLGPRLLHVRRHVRHRVRRRIACRLVRLRVRGVLLRRVLGRVGPRICGTLRRCVLRRNAGRLDARVRGAASCELRCGHGDEGCREKRGGSFCQKASTKTERSRH